jgi:sec-independent protein translocase protein TatB
MMRKAGQYVTKLRRLSSDLRSQSGIDRILREEGLEKEIRELRSLRESLSKHALFDSLVAAANKPAGGGPKSISGSAPKALPKTASAANAELPAATAATGEETAGDKETAASTDPGTVAVASDGTATTSRATNLIRPAAGAVPRGALPPANRTPYRSFREREYPPYGPDHYEALPDDMDEEEDEQPDAPPAAAAEPVVISRPPVDEAAS